MFIYVYVCACVGGYSQKPEESIRSLRVGVTGGCAPLILHLVVLLVEVLRVECSAKAYLLGQPGHADTVSYLPF